MKTKTGERKTKTERRIEEKDRESKFIVSLANKQENKIFIFPRFAGAKQIENLGDTTNNKRGK